MEYEGQIKFLKIGLILIAAITLWNTYRIETLRKSADEDLNKEISVQEHQSAPARKTEKEASSTVKSGKFNVETSARVKNRYVERDIVVPKLKNCKVGAVVVDITVSYTGQVIEAEIGNGTTISDDNILQKFIEAALKTRFSANTSAPEKTSGKITYNISRR